MRARYRSLRRRAIVGAGTQESRLPEKGRDDALGEEEDAAKEKPGGDQVHGAFQFGFVGLVHRGELRYSKGCVVLAIWM